MRVWFPAAALALAVLAAATLVGPPVGLGVAVVAVLLLATAAAAAPRRDPWSAVWWLGAIGLACVPAVRAAAWVVWPSLIVSAALACLAASGGASWRQVGAGLARIRRLPVGAVLVLRPAATIRPRPAWTAPVRGAAIGAALLAVFGGLFASADAAFAHLIDDAVPAVTLDRPFARLAAALAVAGGGGALITAANAGPAAPAGAPRLRLARVEWALPLGALVALFAAFVALQLTALFAGHDHVARTAGLTYAEYARQGFGQLIVAAALTLAVVAAAARWARDEPLLRGLLGALCALTLVVLASALKRLDLYEEAFGYTRARLVAHAIVLWLGGVLVLTLLAGATRRTARLPRGVLALSSAALFAFALSDPDRRVAERNVARYERTGRIDVFVLARLSSDAAPALTRLPPHLADPATSWMRRDLARRDGLAGLNLGRERARRALTRGRTR